MVTKHAKKRLKERAGVHKRGREDYVERVMAEGILRYNTKGRLRKWMDLVWHGDNSKTPVLFGEKCYIFSRDGCLITILNLPSNLAKDRKKMIKQSDRL